MKTNLDIHYVVLFYYVLLVISLLVVFACAATIKYYKKCHHKNVITKSIASAVNCETTAEFCSDCGKQLTLYKTDCR